MESEPKHENVFEGHVPAEEIVNQVESVLEQAEAVVAEAEKADTYSDLQEIVDQLRRCSRDMMGYFLKLEMVTKEATTLIVNMADALAEVNDLTDNDNEKED